jgi:hypothetical protein
MLAQDFRRLARSEDSGDRLVIYHVRQAVGAQQQAVAIL